MGYRIKAKNVNKKDITATVCCGYTTPLKGCTIRH